MVFPCASPALAANDANAAPLMKPRREIERVTQMVLMLYGCHFEGELCHNRWLAQPSIQRELLSQLEHLAADTLECLRIVAVVQRLGDPLANGAHLGLFHAARGKRGCSDADAHGLSGGFVSNGMA